MGREVKINQWLSGGGKKLGQYEHSCVKLSGKAKGEISGGNKEEIKPKKKKKKRRENKLKTTKTKRDKQKHKIKIN